MSPDNLIDGRKIAEQIHSETEQRVRELKARGVEPCLIFVRVGGGSGIAGVCGDEGADEPAVGYSVRDKGATGSNDPD